MVEQQIIIAGFGGQGIMFMGKLLCYAGMLEDKHVTYMPSYGTEVRGGTAYCYVTISAKHIPSPVITVPTSVIIMNTPSLIKFEPMVAKKGLLVVNSSMAHRPLKRKDIEMFTIPATNIADRLGNTRVANLVALGAFLGRRPIVAVETVKHAVEEVLPAYRKHLISINHKALEEGKRYIEAHSSAAIWGRISRGFGFG
jgi:2-oxoglutarate ferredoxin oxidoreductase subunit gamma